MRLEWYCSALWRMVLLGAMVCVNMSSVSSERSLDWDWERSEDGGQTWQLLWRIHYQSRA